MRDSLNFTWRLLATGLCFAAFGLGGLLMALTLFPLNAILARSPAVRRQRAQRLVQRGFHGFLRTVEWLGVGRTSVIGGERLATPGRGLVLANHPTLLDVVVLVSLMPQADCVVKQALWRNPFMRGVVRGAGYVSNSSPEQLLDACAAVLSEERRLLLFPEGTRSVPGRALKFRRGASRIALATGVPIVPVTITCDPPTLMKRQAWYRIPRRAWHIRVMVHEPLAPDALLDTTAVPAPAAVRQMTRALETLFERKIGEHEYAYQRIEGTGHPVAGTGGRNARGHRPAGGAVR